MNPRPIFEFASLIAEEDLYFDGDVRVNGDVMVKGCLIVMGDLTVSGHFFAYDAVCFGDLCARGNVEGADLAVGRTVVAGQLIYCTTLLAGFAPYYLARSKDRGELIDPITEYPRLKSRIHQVCFPRSPELLTAQGLVSPVCVSRLLCCMTIRATTSVEVVDIFDAEGAFIDGRLKAGTVKIRSSMEVHGGIECDGALEIAPGCLNERE
ncbi:MAG TPA: hypothetical protein VFF81_11570 [Noviherbaspirillum sp.]|nr:hypothetical protein [Noviherbaspirillum sp.]